MPSSSFDNFNAGIANLRGGFEDLRKGKEASAKKNKENKETENIKAVADMARSGQIQGIPEDNREGVANLIERMGSTVFGKVFAIAAGEGLPTSLEGLLVHSAVQMDQGQKSGDKSTYDAGLKGITTAVNLYTEVSKAKKIGTELAKGQYTIGGESVDRSGGGGGKGKKGKAGGGEGNLVTHNIIDPATGQIRTVALDKNVFTDINRQLRTMGIGEQKETSKLVGVENTVKSGLRGGVSPGGLFKDFIHSQQTNLLNNLVDTAVKAGHGKYLDEPPGRAAPSTPQGSSQSPIKMATDPVTGKVVPVR